MIPIFVLALAVLGERAEAIRPAATEDRAAIEKYMNEARQISSVDLPEAMELLRKQKSKVSPSSASVVALEREVLRLTNRRNVAMTIAAKLALVAYGLSDADKNGLPVDRRGTAVHPSMRGRPATWVVTYQGDTRDRQAIDAAGAPLRLPGVKGALGQTGTDGYTTLHGMFESPEHLALVLHHERTHFDLLTTRGKGDTLGYFEMEVVAYESSRAALHSFGFTPGELRRREKDINGGINLNTHLAAQESRKLLKRLRLVSPLAPATERPAAFIEKSDLLSKSADDELAAAIEQAHRAERLSRERAERAAREAVPPSVIAERPSFPRELETTPAAPAERPPLPPGLDGTAPSGAAPAHKPDSTSLLRGVAAEACSSAGARPNGLLTYIHTGMNISSADSERARLSGCELAVFDALTRYARGEYGNFTMSASWLTARAAEHRASAAPVQTQPSGPDCFRGGDPFGCQPR